MRHVHTIVQQEVRSGMSNGWRSRPGRRIARRTAPLATAVAAAGIVWLGINPPVKAQTDSWSDGSSNWNNPANWSLGTVPAAGESAGIVNADTQDRTITYDYGGSVITLNTLTIVNTGGGTNTLSLGSSSPALTAETEYIANSGPGSTLSGVGVVSQAGGANSFVQALYLGFNANDIGTYNIQGGSLASATSQFSGGNGSLYDGYAGTGVINQSGGNVAIGTLGTVFVGLNTGSTGSYNLTAGSLAVSNNGSLYAQFDIGYSRGAVGTLTLGTGNPTFTIGGTIDVGNAGSGTFVQQSGPWQASTLEVGGSLFGVQGTAGMGTFNMSGGTLSLNESGWYVGCSTGSIGSCTLSGGLVQNTFSSSDKQYEGPDSFVGLSRGAVTGATGFFQQTGGTINNIASNTSVGGEGLGIYNQSGGSNETYL